MGSSQKRYGWWYVMISLLTMVLDLCIVKHVLMQSILLRHVGVVFEYYPGATEISENEWIRNYSLYGAYNFGASYPVYNQNIDPRDYGKYYSLIRLIPFRNASGGDWYKYPNTAASAIIAGSRACMSLGTTGSYEYNSSTKVQRYNLASRGCNYALYYLILSILPHSKQRVADYPYPNLFKL